MSYGFRRFTRIVWLLSALSFGILLPAANASAQNATGSVPSPDQLQANSSGASITGFRNAEFGMTQAQVLAVINTEFNIPGSAVKRSLNNVQRTAVLNISVPNLIPGGGAASVSYIFGYQSHGLIEVNILWSQATDSKITAATLYQNGESLQQYFAAAGFSPDRSTGNIAMPNGILLFRATDSSANAILLMLTGIVKKDQNASKGTLYPTALTLAYAANPLHPDVFSLPKGSF